MAGIRELLLRLQQQSLGFGSAGDLLVVAQQVLVSGGFALARMLFLQCGQGRVAQRLGVAEAEAVGDTGSGCCADQAGQQSERQTGRQWRTQSIKHDETSGGFAPCVPCAALPERPTCRGAPCAAVEDGTNWRRPGSAKQVSATTPGA
ncbi:hypothetical protein FQZ97_537200 [compost metagenome]